LPNAVDARVQNHVNSNFPLLTKSEVEKRYLSAEHEMEAEVEVEGEEIEVEREGVEEMEMEDNCSIVSAYT